MGSDEDMCRPSSSLNGSGMFKGFLAGGSEKRMWIRFGHREWRSVFSPGISGGGAEGQV